MKPVAEWDESYIIGLPKGEFDWIEFKGRRGLDFSLPKIDENKVLSDLSVEISAFANSGGGTLVYGFTDPKDLSARMIDDGGVPINLKGRNTKEWLEDVIPNLVDHPIRQFNVYALTKSAQNPSVHSGRCVILIEIKDSDDAPHQARDNKYYARVGGKSRPVGHRFITDIFNRRRHPMFQVDFKFESQTGDFADTTVSGRLEELKRPVCLKAVVRNTGRVLAKYVECFFYLPKCLLPDEAMEDVERIEKIQNKLYFVWNEENTKRDIVKESLTIHDTTQYGPSWFAPILPGRDREWTFACSLDLSPDEFNPWPDPMLKPNANEEIIWKIFADNASPTSGRMKLSAIFFK